MTDRAASTPARCARAALSRCSCATLRRAAFDSLGGATAAASGSTVTSWVYTCSLLTMRCFTLSAHVHVSDHAGHRTS